MIGMRTRAAGLMLLLAGSAGCAPPDTAELAYLPPSGEPVAHRSAFVQQQPWLVWGNILDRLQQQGVQVSGLDEATRTLTVAYSGDPEPYVDCGWIVTYEDDELDRLPAARADTSFPRRRDGEVVTLERDLKLDARMNVRVDPSGENAVVRTDSTYALTKTIAGPETEQPLHAETIRFPRGRSGTFSSGTECQATGELERLVFEALPAVSLAGS